MATGPRPQLDLRPAWRAETPAEAVAYFRQKDFKPGFDYRDVWQQEHQASFTVAKAMQADLLRDIRAEVDRALAEGTTLADFQKALTPKLVARGWWGQQPMVDPADGETKMVQLGSPRRLQVIFDTNLATAYSEGQWERIQGNKALFPYLEYVRSASVHPRHTHLAYAGLVLPVNDPFWQSHLPVKEWGCKCTVIQHTRRTLEREGLAVGKAPREVLRTVVNRRTGEVMRVPVGVDPAFHYPPGGRRAHLEKMLADKLAEGGKPVPAAGLAAAAATTRPDPTAVEAARAMRDDKTLDGRAKHVFGPVPPKLAQIFQDAHGLAVADCALIMPVNDVRHSFKAHGDAALEAGRKPPQVAITPEDFAHLPQVAAEFDQAWLGHDAKPLEPPRIVTSKLDAEAGVVRVAVWQLRASDKRRQVALKSHWLVKAKPEGGK